MQNYTNVFLAEYANHSRFSAGTELLWKNRHFTGGLNFRYNHYSKNNNNPAWLSPAIEGDIFARYNWRERVILNLNFGVKGSTFAKYYTDGDQYSVVTLPTSIDLGIKVQYVFNNMISLFIEGNNLTNSKQQELLFYNQKGINFGAGIYFKL